MPNDLSQPTPAIADAKAAKAELEAEILKLVREYERRFECLVSGIILDDRRDETQQRHTYAARITVML